MAWALVNIAEMSVNLWHLDENQNQVWGPVNCIPGTIINLLDYNGSSEYTPPANTVLTEVPDTTVIGDTGYLP